MRACFHTFPKGWPYYPPGWHSYLRDNERIKLSYALMKGMRRCGIDAFIGRKWEPSDAEIEVIWSWSRPKVVEAVLSSGRHLVVMERGFIQPRFEWCSLAVDGFNGRAKFAPASDNGERWERLFSHHLRPWRSEPGEYVLVMGQVTNDGTTGDTDVVVWAQEQTERLRELGHRVRYRPHPRCPTPCPKGAELSTGSLQEDFARADRVVTFNSNVGVEAVLAGLPTVACDEGSIAYPVTSHDVAAPLARPDRTSWCHDMAWRQWSIEELASGEAWAHTAKALDL